MKASPCVMLSSESRRLQIFAKNILVVKSKFQVFITFRNSQNDSLKTQSFRTEAQKRSCCESFGGESVYFYPSLHFSRCFAESISLFLPVLSLSLPPPITRRQDLIMTISWTRSGRRDGRWAGQHLKPTGRRVGSLMEEEKAISLLGALKLLELWGSVDALMMRSSRSFWRRN